MQIAVTKETLKNENRVAITPEITKKYLALGFNINIETGAGVKAGFSDEEYAKSGAKICPSAKHAIKDANIVIKINAPTDDEIGLLSPSQIIIANFQALAQKTYISKFAKKQLTCFALDLLPRISRAQSMDILSSQNNIAGYKAVIEALNFLPKAAPLMMTSAGTISPAKVLILGTGVAGLQAIATAKRMGAQVFASDIRPNTKEQVESLGGKFIEIKTDEVTETSDGYAKETSKEFQKLQKQAVSEALKQTDVVITTALIPGKKAPILIDYQMLKNMPQNSVIIDMASAYGGNVEGSQDNAIIEKNGIKIIGNSNLASAIPFSASRLFAQNIYNFVYNIVDKTTLKLNLNFDDEIISATCICNNGHNLLENK